MVTVTVSSRAGFSVKVRRDVHQRIDANSFGEDVLSGIRPFRRHRHRDRSPEFENNAGGFLRRLRRQDFALRQKSFDSLLHSAQRGAP